MKVEMFNVGWISSSAALWRRGEDPQATIRFPVPAYLIETERERVLIDTGLHPEAVLDPAGYYERPEAGMFELEQQQAISGQLDLSTVTRLVLTHLHFDHVGGLALVPAHVPVVIQRAEWEASRDEAAIARNFLYPRDYAMLQEHELVLVDGEHDLLGDGSVRLMRTPGHTPGHQSVRVGETLVIGVDVTHFASTLEDRRFPAFADDHEAQERSADRLLTLREDGARVLPGHDAEVLIPGPVVL